MFTGPVESSQNVYIHVSHQDNFSHKSNVINIKKKKKRTLGCFLKKIPDRQFIEWTFILDCRLYFEER